MMWSNSVQLILIFLIIHYNFPFSSEISSPIILNICTLMFYEKHFTISLSSRCLSIYKFIFAKLSIENGSCALFSLLKKRCIVFLSVIVESSL